MIEAVHRLLRSDHGRELVRFLVVGFTVVGVDFTVYFLLLRLFPQVSVTAAKTVSFVAGASLAFFLNRSFVFASQGEATKQIAPFALLYGCTLTLNTGANWVALALGCHRPLAWLLATGTSTVSNFLGMKLIVFRNKEPLHD